MTHPWTIRIFFRNSTVSVQQMHGFWNSLLKKKIHTHSQDSAPLGPVPIPGVSVAPEAPHVGSLTPAKPVPKAVEDAADAVDVAVEALEKLSEVWVWEEISGAVLDGSDWDEGPSAGDVKELCDKDWVLDGVEEEEAEQSPKFVIRCISQLYTSFKVLKTYRCSSWIL